jgi:putative heme-binding domain-containing protein
MIELTKSPLKDVVEKAMYWVSFRQSNDWFGLLDWSKTGIDTKHERQVASMKVTKNKIQDELFPFAQKKGSVREMAKDPVGGQMLIAMLAENSLAKTLYPFVEEVIFKNPDQSVRIQASNYFKVPGSSHSFSIGAISKLKGNAISGKAIFNKSCATCHRVNKEGSSIGPDLTEIHKKFDRPGLLDAIANPSAAIVFGYEPWLIINRDGESVFGFLVADGEKTVVVKDISGKNHTVETAKIKSRKKQENSLMPVPSALGLSEQNLADLAEYLDQN